jgi:tetratricopeptide (TPR) repeat protein
MRVAGILPLLGVLTVSVPGQGRIDVFVTKARKAEAAGNLPLAVAHLQSAHRLAPDNESLSKALAALHTQVGLGCYKGKDLDGALLHFGAADRLTPNIKGILQSLGVIHFAKGNRTEAKDYMDRVLKLDPTNTAALTVLGNLARQRDETQKASDYYSRAAAGDPSRSDLKSLAKRLDKHAKIERTFTTSTRGNFHVKYQGGRDAGVERNINLVFGHLERATEELFKQLRCKPTRMITVMVYTDDQYRQVAVHAWARAHYDGKIRIAVRPNTSLQESMRADLRHELTHAFLFELFPKAPLWVHEGYAQLIDGHSVGAATSRFRNGRGLLPKHVFLGRFNESADDAVIETAYAQSLMAVGYLNRAGSRRQFRTFLGLVGEGASSDDALQQVYRFDVNGMLAKARRQ